MRFAHTKRLGIAVLVGSMSVVALLAGAAVAGGGGITEPTALELVTTGCGTNDDDPATHCHVYGLKDEKGDRSGEIARFKVPLWDLEGNDVGNVFLQCMDSKTTGSMCTAVYSLKSGPFTEQGTIVSTGVNLPPKAITGGSGAYLNVRGDISGEDQSDGFHVFLNLIP